MSSAVNECDASAMLPLECQYLNKSALTTLVGPLNPPIKHFQLKRKPKSATLRAELLQKCKSQSVPVAQLVDLDGDDHQGYRFDKQRAHILMKMNVCTASHFTLCTRGEEQ